MSEQRRPFLDYGDLLILLGVVLLLLGLYLIDWRLALVGGGGLLIVLGAARLKMRSGGQ